MKKGRKQFVLIVVLATSILIGCTKSSTTIQKENNEIVIPVTFLVNPETSQSDNQELVEMFNKEFEGTYRVEVEWLTETASGYRSKLKQWNALDEMPAIITDVGFDADFYELLINNDRLVDLRPYMEESSEWMEDIQKDILEDCIEKNGEIYLSPLGNLVYSYAGFIYNKDLLKKAGIKEFPTTWDDFWNCLTLLEQSNIIPLALHGRGSYWVPMLIGNSYMESTNEGKAFLEEQFPTSYSNTSIEQMLQMIQRMYQYSFENAVDLEYSQAEQKFLNGEAAIIANGYWMIESMDTDMQEHYGFASFPQEILMVSPRMSAWAVTSGYDKDVTEGAVKFLEYRIKKNHKESEAFLAKKTGTSLVSSYIDAIRNVKTIMPNYQLKWEQQIQNEFFTENIPLLINQTISEKEFINAMNNKIKEIQQEK